MIAGLDPSTKRIGYAAPDGRLWSISARAGAKDRARRLHELRRQLERLISLYPPAPELVMIEGYALNTPGRLGLVRQAELGGVVRLALFELGIPFFEIEPSRLKLYATGSGGADKPRMIEAALELGAATTATALNDDEADAFLLRHLGRMAYGLEAIERGGKLSVLSTITFPRLDALVPSGELTSSAGSFQQ